MIHLVEGARRQKTPNEIALTVLLSILTLIFVIVVAAMAPGGVLPQRADQRRRPDSTRGRADSDDHRRAAFRDRDCRDRPDGAVQRARHVGKGRRGCRRRADAASSTRPAPSPSAIARPPSSSRPAPAQSNAWRRPHCWLRISIRRRRVARWCRLPNDEARAGSRCRRAHAASIFPRNPA